MVIGIFGAIGILWIFNIPIHWRAIIVINLLLLLFLFGIVKDT